MTGKTHMLIGGLTAGVAVALAVTHRRLGFDINGHTAYPALFVLPAIVGGLGPDVDMPNSISGRFVRKFLTYGILGIGATLFVLVVATIVRGGDLLSLASLAVLFILTCGVMFFISKAKHRRETHSGLFCLILILPLSVVVIMSSASLLLNLLISLWVGFWIGWVSHLVADSFNKRGVPWLYPLKNTKGKLTYYSVMSITTGTHEETIFKICATVVIGLVCLLIIFAGRLFV